MDILPTDLRQAAASARDRLTALSFDAARADAGSPGARPSLAGAAREAIFADALLGAMHARFEELRSVAK